MATAPAIEPPTDYQYSAFVSYKRSQNFDAWTREFVRHLEFHLTQELAQPLGLFYDSESIQTGQSLPRSIQGGLLYSRCIVCLLSPNYFRSAWCIAEWKTFEDRQIKTSSELIVPISLFDGKYYPQYAAELKVEDLTDYAFVAAAFWSTERGVELEARIKQLSKRIAHVANSAPSFDPRWPIRSLESVQDDLLPPAFIPRPVLL